MQLSQQKYFHTTPCLQHPLRTARFLPALLKTTHEARNYGLDNVFTSTCSFTLHDARMRYIHLRPSQDTLFIFAPFMTQLYAPTHSRMARLTALDAPLFYVLVVESSYQLMAIKAGTETPRADPMGVFQRIGIVVPERDGGDAAGMAHARLVGTEGWLLSEATMANLWFGAALAMDVSVALDRKVGDCRGEWRVLGEGRQVDVKMTGQIHLVGD
ncbi:hypothetical protein BP6252_11009 [Coleophoma cylindrospora]|uniref:Uncharacterized protein n=1 Tax=Coleophoma cylindrospora TaxID=1849047 RepID=A0A3D8QPT0_9HELO|nr:hypothetical protein BP6252_11009 [Coleophoma cylindrospora]